MSYLGSWKVDDYLTFCCNTHDPDTGVATDADAVPTYRVYEDETGTPILTGSTAKLDDANTTGFYSERIQLTAANGIEKGKCYTIYISATVDSDTGTMHHNFQIEAEVDANTVSASNVSANVAQIEGADPTDTIRDSVVDDATRIDASALNTLSGKTPSKAYLAGSADADGGIDNTEAAVIQSECNDALVAQKLDHLVAVADSDDPVNDSIVAKLAASDGDWSGFDKTTDSLEAIRDRGDAEWTTGAAAGLTADDIWDEEMDTNAPGACNTAREYMNVLISGIAGETAGTGDWSARDLGDTKTRIQGTLSAAGARSSIDTLDGT